MLSRPSVSRLLALVVLGAAAVLPVALVAPAQAASGACERGTGVTVVVNSTVRCDPTPGSNARESFAEVGFRLEDVPGQTGAVCKIDGSPGDNRCFETDAYWALYVSDGTSGSWRYASTGVNGVRVPAGTWAAFVWQGSTTRTAPSMTPIGPAAAPAPAQPGNGSGSGSGSGTAPGPGQPSPGAATSTASPEAAATPDASTTPDPTATTSDQPGAVANDDTEGRDASATSAATDDGGGPWGAIVAVLALAGLGGAAFLVQRRRSAGA